MIQKSPLRYPGSKPWILSYIEQVIQDNGFLGSTIIEPYAGSAIVSLSMVERNICPNAILIERDPLLYAFWRCVFECSEALINRINNTEIDMNAWIQYSAFREFDFFNENHLLDMGMAGLFLNRTCYSGILKAGPLGGHGQESQYTLDCRFKKAKIIEWIKHLAKLHSRIQVVFSDALDFLYQLNNDNQFFLYLDPPYYAKGKSLYRYWYEDNDHKNLARYLHECHFPWLLSYDDHPRIRELYNDEEVFKRDLTIGYFANQKRIAPEILISNLEIPPWMFKIEAN